MPLTEGLSPEALSALVDASAAINATQRLGETLASIARAAAAVMNAEASSVIMLNVTGDKQVFRAAVGERSQALIGLEYDAGVGISGKVLASGQAEIVNDVDQEKSHYKDIDAHSGFRTRSLIAAPLVNRGQKLGVVEVINPLGRHHFGPDHLRLCEVFANLAAIAAANAQLRDRLERENVGLKDSVPDFQEMVGDSPAMRHVKDLILSVAPANSTVLLLGETGTGKELAARMLHANSRRAAGPFIAVNCAALPESLLESELFGHEAGAFTGAAKRRLGRFELAEDGTIFLDEVAEMAPSVQASFLRVLEEKQITRVGGAEPVRCDVRVVAATNRDLAEAMRAGRFREDLFYRLNVFPIEIPPLRLRREDIPPLARHFVERMAAEMNVPPPAVSEEAMARLLRYDFPGNVRELRNILERACLLCCCPGRPDTAGGRLDPAHLPREVGGETEAPAPGQSALQAHEKTLILDALAANDWNQTRAATALGISRDNLRYRVKKHGIRRPG